MNVNTSFRLSPTSSGKMTIRKVITGDAPIIIIEFKDGDGPEEIDVEIDATIPGEDGAPDMQDLRDVLELVLEGLGGEGE